MSGVRVLRHRCACLMLWLAVLCCAAVWSFPAPAADASPHAGQEIYRAQCAKCHGPQGEGIAEKHDEPLYGDLPVEDLAKVIQETMPKDAPRKCTAEEAAQVAKYIHGTFYTAEARARNKPPRIELSHLTVPQYRNAVADLLSQFSNDDNPGSEHGLKATYYNSRNFSRDKKILERVDPQVSFYFAQGSPEKEKIGVEEFSMQWQGSLIAEETGDYELCLATENGARLFLNNQEKPLIDAWVASGGEVAEHTESIFLLGGRAYPLRLEYFKFKDKSASIALRWKTPERPWEVVPQRNLATNSVRSTLITSTPFPPDDRSVGYERGTAVSKAWDLATTNAAIEVANKIVDRLDELAGTGNGSRRGRRSRDGESSNNPPAAPMDRAQKLKEFCYRLTERAFRHPLTDEQKQTYVDAQFAKGGELDLAVKRVLLVVLKSPWFLYPEFTKPSIDDYDVASRLSFGLWDSLPDAELLKAASENRLHTPEQIGQQAQRMLKNPRAKAKVQTFFNHWLQFDDAAEISKDLSSFPGFDESFIADLRTSLEMFIDEVVWSDQSDFRQLLLADYLFLNARLARFYGFEPPPDGVFEKIDQDPKQRTGVVTHPYLMSAFAYHKSSSPIHRGVFVTRKLLGRSLKPPPQAIQFMDGSFDPGLTMREKVASLTKPVGCQTCHSVINPLGFSLENYDAVGRYRTEDKDKPIDASVEYKTAAGEVVTLNGARGLAEFAATSTESHRAFVEQVFQHLVKQPAGAYGPDTLAKLTASFEESQFNIQRLLVDIMRATASAVPVRQQGESR